MKDELLNKIKQIDKDIDKENKIMTELKEVELENKKLELKLKKIEVAAYS